MPARSSIKRLPQPLRQELDKLLASGRHTLDEICQHLRALGGEVSRSAVGRYSQEFEEAAAKIRESREIAAAFARELGDVPDGDMGRVLVELVHSLTYKVVMARAGDEGDIDPLEIQRLAKAIKDLSSSSKISADMELKIKEAAKQEAQEEMRAKLDDAVQGDGLDPAVAEEALRVLGFA